MTKFGERWDKSLKELVVEAGIKALVDSNLSGNEIEAVYGGTMAAGRLVGQEHVGALLADAMGLNPLPSIRVEAACASGGMALREAYMAIASGYHDVVVVGGVEKMTDVSTGDATIALAGAGDVEWEYFSGATFPAVYALLAKKHMAEFGTTEEQMAQVAVKNHENGSKNEYAQYQNKITLEQVMKSKPIAEPLKILDCSPITDGAAALVLASSDIARKYSDTPIEISGVGMASDTLPLHDRASLIELNATKVAAEKAYRQAGVTPKEINFAEVHDCFTIAELLAVEDLGFFPKGKGGPATQEGETALNSKISINTSGGLKACGHPVGATGVKQAVEATWQLRGEGKGRQVDNAEIGLTHNVGGSGATAIVHIMKRVN
jgi:acetyl-CoA C-acetyltransferase